MASEAGRMLTPIPSHAPGWPYIYIYLCTRYLQRSQFLSSLTETQKRLALYIYLPVYQIFVEEVTVLVLLDRDIEEAGSIYIYLCTRYLQRRSQFLSSLTDTQKRLAPRLRQNLRTACWTNSNFSSVMLNSVSVGGRMDNFYRQRPPPPISAEWRSARMLKYGRSSEWREENVANPEIFLTPHFILKVSFNTGSGI